MEQLAGKILQRLPDWTSGKPKTIIGLEGYSAAGKTTLLKELARVRPEILPVHVDDFLNDREIRHGLAEEPTRFKLRWDEASWYRYPPLAELIEAFLCSAPYSCDVVYNRDTGFCDMAKTWDTEKDMMIIEGALLYRPPLDRHIDRLVYLEIDKELANKRQRKRIKESGRPQEEIPKHAAWVSKFDRVYSEYVKACQPVERADLVLQVIDSQP